MGLRVRCHWAKPLDRFISPLWRSPAKSIPNATWPSCAGRSSWCTRSLFTSPPLYKAASDGRVPSTMVRILGRWKIGRLNGRYLCGEECIALNILNGITRRQNGFTYAEARIRLSKSGTQAAREKAGLLKPLTIAGIREAVEVGRDYLGLRPVRSPIDQ